MADRLEALANQLMTIVSELRGTQPSLSEDVAARIAHFAKAQTCLHCGQSLSQEGSKRGLHNNCYAALMQRISRGQTTEQELIAEGRMAPKQKQGRKYRPLPPLPSLPGQSSGSVDSVVDRTVAEVIDKARELSAAIDAPKEPGGKKLRRTKAAKS